MNFSFHSILKQTLRLKSGSMNSEAFWIHSTSRNRLTFTVKMDGMQKFLNVQERMLKIMLYNINWNMPLNNNINAPKLPLSQWILAESTWWVFGFGFWVPQHTIFHKTKNWFLQMKNISSPGFSSSFRFSVLGNLIPELPIGKLEKSSYSAGSDQALPKANDIRI